MRAVMVMYDSLNKRYLSPYGNTWVKTPNFERLARHCGTFDNCYVGSLPCMPARRELHTGRLNFLHRGWCPIEPFDESMPGMLNDAGIYAHLITDHCHYWEDGGVNYQNRFTTSEYIRGQEGDAWAVMMDGFDGARRGRRQDRANRGWMKLEEEFSHVRCFERGKKFLTENKDRDNWYLQLEYFDPHEPFYVPERFKKMYTDLPSDMDWPFYRPLQGEDRENLKEYVVNYAALVTMCDEYLGKILDLFDKYDMWKDTLLIVNTDHGYMLGEKDFVGKNYMPVYDELANIPFFMHIPSGEGDGERRKSLVQTPDIAPTVLDFFDLLPGKHMLGKSMIETLKADKPVHGMVLYGYHGMHVNITDGVYTYMRCAQNGENQPLYQYTLMPSHIMKPMALEEIKQASLYPGFEFNDYTPVLKIPVDERYDKKAYYRYSDHMKYGSLLFNRKEDPQQLHPIEDEELETRYARRMTELMEENEAPMEQYIRLGLQEYI
ncbi:sulfatase-like hydrolase/transferase [Clostridium sp. MCC353]|uniref:sulfatase n=1 Tax=Clostridium sp. MCC353 TaxID=2592646 RepID=UPI001C00ECE9|nr:sulfatase [Clostridium sp. MCC353]MBT9776738.1 sulfatase-like hydrolase/transferase [Clostridium sp. MCC353]